MEDRSFAARREIGTRPADSASAVASLQALDPMDTRTPVPLLP